MTAPLLAGIVGIFLALTTRALNRRKTDPRAPYELIAAQQRALQGLDQNSFAATQLRQKIDAQVLVLNNGLIHPVVRRRAAAWAGLCLAVVGIELVWLASRPAASIGDAAVTCFSVGFFGTMAMDGLRIVLHRNKIRGLSPTAQE